ncbi:hypothetical protein CVT26_005272 [Gymnopilus dilepis]|uniref:Uncharacterized protein n=1 Tax=Gymnopilus dilepis TaxID=231916 RepID=A0A409X8E1_9AGAR|nr:hypothetical protein CVT26_005272 [Gymnopilus dilepis]
MQLIWKIHAAITTTDKVRFESSERWAYWLNVSPHGPEIVQASAQSTSWTMFTEDDAAVNESVSGTGERNCCLAQQTDLIPLGFIITGGTFINCIFRAANFFISGGLFDIVLGNINVAYGYGNNEVFRKNEALQVENEALRGEIEALQARNHALEEEIEVLRRRIAEISRDQ